MASKDLTYKIGVDSSQGVTGVKQFSSTVKRELKSIEGDFDETATAGEKVATVLSKMAGQLDVELAQAAQAADALRAALGEDLAGRADVGAIVGDLQRMGLSFDEITADADKLAASLKELDTVQVRGLDAGLGGVDTKMGKLRDSSDQTRSVLANLTGNTAQDLGQLGGFAGSAGVAIGQLAEYATEGGIALKNLVALAAPMIVMTVTAKALASHFGDIAETEAFNKEQVEGFTDSLEEGATAASAIAEHLKEVGKVEFRLFDETQDLGENLAALGLTVDQFSQLASRSAEDIRAWGDAMIESGADSRDVNLVMLAATKTAENLGDAQKLAAQNAKIFGDETKKTAAKMDSATRQYLQSFQTRQRLEAEVAQDAAEAQKELIDNFAAMAQGVREYSTAVESVDWGAAELEGAVTGMHEFTDAHLGLARIAQQSADANKALTESVKENGKAFDFGTKAGLKNLDAIEGVAEAVDTKLAAAYASADGNQRKFVRSATAIADETLARLSDRLNLSTEETAQLAEALGLMPEDIKTRYELSGTEEAQLKLDLLSGSIEGLPENVETKVTQKIIEGDYQGALDTINNFYKENPATLPVKVTWFNTQGPGGTGLGAPPVPGGLSAGPMTTAAAPVPMVGPTLPTLTLPVAGAPSRQPVVINNYTTLQAAVIGDPYAVAQAVEDASRRNARLQPTVP